MERTDRDAIRDVLAGDRDSYRVLMDRHFQTVFRVAFRITGEREDAEEAAQETFLRAFRSLASFRLDATFATWITRIAMNTSLNLVERRNRDLARTSPRIGDENSAEQDTVQVADAAAGPERLVFNRQAVALREQAMRALTPMERTAFTMRHMEDQPLAEIAAALNIPANSVKQAIFRAVGKLRRSLAPLAGGLQ